MVNSEKVMHFFGELCKIPRASRDEKAVSDYLVKFAEDRNLEHYQDDMYNVIIKKPATVEGAGEPVILQGHIDMVYVKAEGSDHVYENGLELMEDDEFYFANGTSLGADNGIAVAYTLAILDSDEIAHPDLEAVFTVQEEIGLFGAEAVDMSKLNGTRFINIDSEEEGIFFTSCAGGLRSVIRWDVVTEKEEAETVPVTVSFSKLAGGHSGMNIAMGKGNALVLLGRLMYALKDSGVRVSGIDAPGKSNAIASAASVCFHVKKEALEEVKALIAKTEKDFQTELQYTDEIEFIITEGKAEAGADVYTDKLVNNIMKTLMLIPNGVFANSFAIEGLVETSMNMGSLAVEDGKLELGMSVRSSVATQKEFLKEKVRLIAEEYGDDVLFDGDYPGWQFKKESPLRDTAVAVYEKMFNKKAEVAAIHAGLECGYFDAKKPGMDIISMGPDLFDVHSPKERMSKKSMENIWMYLQELLKELAK